MEMWKPVVFGVIVLASALVLFGPKDFQVLFGKPKPIIIADISPPKPDNVKKTYEMRFQGYAKDRDPTEKPTDLKVWIEETGEEMVVPYSIEGDDYVVVSDKPDFRNFVSTHWNTSKMVLGFRHTFMIAGHETQGGNVIMRDPTKKAAEAATP